MTLRTAKQAQACICPIARVSGAEKPSAKCVASACILWRWADLLADDPRVQSAVVREVALMRGETKEGEKPLSDDTLRKRAIARIAANKDGYIVRDENDKGWCGLAGRPE